MKFSELDFNKITSEGFDKLLVMKNGEMIVGGRVGNIPVYMPILKDKRVIAQYGDVDIWVVEIAD